MKIFTRIIFITIPVIFSALFSFSQTSWKGTISTKWSLATNWTAGVPNAATDAILGDANFTGANQPTVDLTSACKSLTIGGTIATTLTESRNLTVSGNVLINANGVLKMAGVTLSLTGSWTNNGSYTYTSTAALVLFSGVAQSINGPVVTAFRKLTVNTGSVLTMNVNFSTAGLLTVNGTINPNTSPTYLVSPGSMTINSGSKLLVYAATFSGNYALNPTIKAGSTIEYASSLINQTVSSLTYATLTISGTTTKSLAANLPALLSSVASGGNIYVKSGIFDLLTFTANRGAVTVGGNIEVWNSATLKIGGTNGFPSNYNSKVLQLSSTVNYYGTNQTVTAITYGNIILSSSAGAVTKTMPATAFTVEGDFISTLASGTSVLYTAVSAITINGDINIGTGTTFSGGGFSHILAGDWINNGTFTGSTSTITITGASTTISGTGTHNFNNLTITVSNIVADATSNLSLSGNLLTTGAGQLTHNAGGTVTMTGASKTITGANIILSNLAVSGTVTTASTFIVSGNLTVSGALTASAGTITMNGASKTITGAGSIGFYSLAASGTLSATASFTIASSLDVSGTLTATAGTATFTNSSNLNGTANLFNATINGTSLTLSANSVLGIANTFTITAGILNVTSNTTNTVNFNGTGAQSVNAITYHHLILSNGNTKTAANGITTNGDLTINTGTIFSAVSYTHQVYGNWVNNGTFTAGTSTVQFRGAANKTITGASTFYILTINKTFSTNTISLNNNVLVPTLNMTTGTLLTGANTITITTTRTGTGIILGTITRTHTFSIATAYEFEGPDNRITFTAVTGVTSITVYAAAGAIGDFPNGGSINRVYDITVPGGTYVATLRLHYEDAELNGNNEAAMQLWRYNGTVWGASGKTGNNTTTNYVEQTGLTNITNRWTCTDNPGVARWNGSVSTAWNNAANWTTVSGSPFLPPGANDIAQIGSAAFTNQPLISTAVLIKSIVFGSAQAATLTIGSGGSLTTSGNINGSWSANAVHTVNAGNQNLTVNGDLSLSNGTASRAIDLLIGTGTVTVAGSLTQTGGANVSFSAAGTLNIKTDYLYSSGTFTAGIGTVQYTGTGSQTVAALTYNHLTINKATGIALVNAVSTVGGDLTILAGELDLFAAMTVTGNTSISSGAIFDGNAVTLNIGGNWTNSGTFVAGTGTVNINGTGTQNMSATTFNNLIINKSSGPAILTGNSTVNGNLTLQTGTFDLAAYTCNRSSAGGVLTVANGASLYLGGANNFPANFTTNSLGSSSTVLYNGSGVQSVAGVTYGNLTFSNGGANAKTFVAAATVNGDILINSGATLHSGGFSLTLLSNWTNSGTFTPSTGTVIFNGTAKIITGNTTFNRITVNGSYTVANNDIVYNDLINIGATGSYAAGGGVATVNGDLTNRGTLTSTGTTTFTGTILQTLRLINAISSTSTGIVNFNGTVSPVMNSTSSPQFATVNINNTAGVNPSIEWVVFVAMNVNSGGIFNGGVSTHTIYGNFTNAGTTTSPGTLNFIPSSAKTINFGSSGFSSTGTVIFGGAGAITLSGTAGPLNNVIIANTNALGVTPSSGWNMTGKFTINSNAKFNAASYAYTVGTDIDSDGTLNGGTSTFTMNSVAGTLTGSPTTIFNHFTIAAAAIITANSDFSVAGNYTNNGTYDGSSGNLIMTGSSAATIGGTPVSNDLSQLIIAKTGGAAVSMGVSISNVYILYIQSGTLFTSTFGITQDVAGGFLIIDNAATLKLGGTNSLPAFSGYALDANSNVDYAGTTQSIGNAAVYGNLWITAAGNKTAIVPFITLGNFTLSDGTFTSPITVTHYIGGNWLMSGGTFTNTNITIELNGTANQGISSTGAFKNLTLNKTTGLATLASNVTVNNTLTFTNGKISVLGYNLTIPATAVISGATAAKYVIAEAAGTLIQQVTAGGTKLYPVGTTANYVPATITLTGGSATDNFRVRVMNFVYNQGTNGFVLANFAVNNTWFITEETVGGSDATITLQWPALLELPGFMGPQSRVSQSSGLTYTFGPLSPASGANPYTSNKPNVTGFNAFAVLNNLVILSVTWLNTSGENKNGDNYINWNVANERANNNYTVEYAANGTNFTTIGNVAGKGSITSSNAYLFIHKNVSGTISYYRIKQIDANGSFTYSSTIKINNSGVVVNEISITPNPVITYSSLIFKTSVSLIIDMLIFDASGNKLGEQKVSVQRGTNSIPLDFTGYNAGIYFIHLIDENKTKQVLKVFKK
jgi:fibronectin-binding autotransporter adhesin